MKVNRHAKIIELINKYHIETQEELAEYMNQEGFRRLLRQRYPEISVT